VDNQAKETGRVFRQLADAHRGQPVVIPSQPLPPPPVADPHDPKPVWDWLLAWMKEFG